MTVNSDGTVTSAGNNAPSQPVVILTMENGATLSASYDD